MRWLAISFILFSSACVAEDPWGRDADLLEPRCKLARPATRTSIAQALIQGYQCYISPSNGPRSSYVPSSSQYTLEAMRCYGFYWGWLYGCDRLMRENGDPWIYSTCFNHEGFNLKWDPVP